MLAVNSVSDFFFYMKQRINNKGVDRTCLTSKSNEGHSNNNLTVYVCDYLARNINTKLIKFQLHLLSIKVKRSEQIYSSVHPDKDWMTDNGNSDIDLHHLHTRNEDLDD